MNFNFDNSNENWHITPKIKPNREFGRDHFGEYCVMFYPCKHILTLPKLLLRDLQTNYRILQYINNLICTECEKEMNEMEWKLNNEYNKFIQDGGKL